MSRRPATAAVHAGRPTALPGEPVVPPVHRSVIYEFSSAEEFGAVMAEERPGYLYTRIRNPTTDELAGAVAELEGAPAAACFASGMAAISTAFDVLAPAGAGPVVAGRHLYGQTFSLLRDRSDTRFVDLDDADAVRAALPGAAMLYAETISNPLLAVADLPALAAAARETGVPLVVDSTLATPVGCRPLALGADLVLHSATKYLNGHSDVLAGVAAGGPELVGRLVARSLDTGATLAPDSAWLVRRGLKTLHLRFERASTNADAIARRLEEHPAVRSVRYPGLSSHPSHAVARSMLAACGGVLAFEVEGGRAGGERVMDRVRVCLRATSLGGVDTVISHPASTSHRQLSDAELGAAGLSQGYLRLSVGCEDVQDLLDDLESALA